MYGVIYVPNFQLQAALRDREDLTLHMPIALLDGDEKKAAIIQLTSETARYNIHPGLTANQGLARCAFLELLYRNLDLEDKTQRDLLQAAAGFTPDFEATALGILTLDLNSHPNLSAQEKALAHQLHRRTEAIGLTTQIGLGDNPDLAFLAAHLADPILTLNGNVREQLEPLSIAALQPPKDLANILDLWGVRTLGDLTRLPRQDVVLRLGPDAAHLWDRAHGGKRRLLQLVHPAADFSQSMEWDYGIDQLEPLLFILRRLLETVAARLQSAYFVAAELLLTLTCDNGFAHERTFRIPEPCADPEMLFRVLHTYLESFSTNAPIVACRLEARPAQVSRREFDLFASSLADPNRFFETLGRLEALLGSDRVGTPRLLPTFRADAFEMQPFSEEIPKTSAESRIVTVGLPLNRFRPPLPVLVRTETAGPLEISQGPVRGRIVGRRGPWISSGDWWDQQAWRREDWDVQMEGGELYRLVRNPKNWFVEGVYG